MTSSDLNSIFWIPPTPIELRVGEKIIPWVDHTHDKGLFKNDLIPLLRHGIYYETGFLLPDITIIGRIPQDMAVDAFTVLVREMPVAYGKIVPDHFLVEFPKKLLKKNKIPFQITQHPVLQYETYWIPNSYQEFANSKDCRRWNISEYLITILCAYFKANVDTLLDLATTYKLVEEFEKSHSQLVKDIIPHKASMVFLNDFLKALLHEKILIRDLTTIFEILARYGQGTKNSVNHMLQKAKKHQPSLVKWL